MLSQPTDTRLAVPEPEAPKTKNNLVTVLIILVIVLVIGVIIAASNGIIVHDGTLMKPNSDLSTSLIVSGCDSTAASCSDQPCVATDGSNAGVEVNNKCYVDIFDNTIY
jgi:ABC-type glucose/galactose transport system permease subunit